MQQANKARQVSLLTHSPCRRDNSQGMTITNNAFTHLLKRKCIFLVHASNKDLQMVYSLSRVGHGKEILQKHFAVA